MDITAPSEGAVEGSIPPGNAIIEQRMKIRYDFHLLLFCQKAIDSYVA